MSYCRWSTVLPDGFESDLYIYDHCDGHISVNIAGGRLAGIENAPKLQTALTDKGRLNTDAYLESYMARNKWREENEDKLEHVLIELEHAGETYNFQGSIECVEFLKKLKALGYRMPEFVLNVENYES